MSIFSNIRKSRQQAKEHNAKLAQQEKKEQKKAPYKHVPTHAATDAFASAPPSWREADRPRILEENRRRSAMAANGHHMNMPGAPRVGSSLSHVTYPGEDATPIVRLPRAYSYTQLASCSDRGPDAAYMVPDMTYLQPAPYKGKDVTRGPAYYDTMRTSPTPSKGERSSVGSSSASTSSQDDLEIRPYHSAAAASAARPGEASHWLHASHPRRASDASMDRRAMANSAKGPGPSSYIRDSRPPPSMRGFASIAQVTAPLPMHLVSMPRDIASHGAPTSSRGSTKSASTSGTLASRPSSMTSLSTLTPTSSRLTVSAPVTPMATTAGPNEDLQYWGAVPHAAGLDMARSYDGVGMAHAPTEPRPKEQGGSEATRLSHLERIESTGAELGYQHLPRADGGEESSHVGHEDLVINVFPEPVSLPEPGASSSRKSKKMAKGGGRLVKKSRWSGTKTFVVAV